MHPAQPYISALSAEIGIDIALSPSGTAAFSADGRSILIQWADSPERFALYSDIGFISPVRTADVMRRLLSANFLMHGARGLSLSLNPETGMVGLNAVLRVYGITAQDFLQLTDHFVRLADDWQKRLEQMNADARRTAAALGRAEPEPEPALAADPQALFGMMSV